LGADPVEPIFTEIANCENGVDDNLFSTFGFNILGASDLQGAKMSVFQLTLLVIVATVLLL